MDSTSKRWRTMGDPASAAEAEALEAVRALLPDDAITHAWANLTFIDLQGRTAEVDVLLLTRAGLFVVELKGWHGRISGDQQTWRLTAPNGSVRHERNPLFATDAKAKRLRSLLEHVAPNAQARRAVPFVGAFVVLHGRDSVVELPDVARAGIVALDGAGVRHLTPTLREFLDQPLAQQAPIDGPRATQILHAIDHAGIRPTPKQRFVGQYSLEKADPLDDGQGWQDLLAAHPSAPSVLRRIRLFSVPPGASADQRAEIERAARREFVLTQGVAHDGVVVPRDLVESDSGPALIFDYDPSAVRLDAYLADRADKLTLDGRMALVRQLAEILRYAHQRRLVHRALTPRQVYVGPGQRLTVRDWQTARRASSTSTATPTATSLGAEDVRGLVETAQWVYLAPEAHRGGDVPPIPLDVYGLGALAFLILTGRPPAASLAELSERLQAQGGLDPRLADPSVPDVLADLVLAATARVESERLATVEDLLAGLDLAEEALTTPDEVERRPARDPLEAVKDEEIAGRFFVAARRGSGSTGTVLLVVDTERDADESKPTSVLKIAKDDAAARRLADEAEVLRQVDHPRIVRLIEGPIEVDGRQALLLSDAGAQTMAARLSAQGRCTLGELERFGADLLSAVAHLDERGLFHRDLKPANLGVSPHPGTKVPRLVLFDLSLAREPLDHTTSGTRGYLDPYLGRGPAGTGRRQYDRAAELYSVAITLFEMATAQLPWWADGEGAPASPTDTVVLTTDMFEAPVAAGMVAFFRRALAPKVADRFPDIAAMAQAWAALFSQVAAEDDEAEQAVRDAAAAAATLDTPLADAGLTARALSPLARLGARTVGELLRINPGQITVLAGLGEVQRKEVMSRLRAWQARLLTAQPDVPAPSGDRSVESVLNRLVPRTTANNGAEVAALRLLLGLDGELLWPSATDLAEPVGVTRPRISQILDAAAARWAADATQLGAVRKEVLETLAAEEGVVALEEVAHAILLRHGSIADGPARLRRAAGLVRAVVELDQRDAEPALAVRRPRAGGAILALADHASLLDDAVWLASRAADLVADGAVVPAAAARAALRGAHTESLTEDRVLRMAAALAADAHLSALHELYRADLDPARAVDAALRGVTAASFPEAVVRRKVADRFPALAPLPPRPALDALVAAAIPGARWDTDAYVRPTHRSTRASTVTTLAPERSDVVTERLTASLARAGALTLCAHPRHYAHTAAALERRFGVRRVDVAALLVDSLRAMADAENVAWDLVVSSDATRSGGDWDALRGLVTDAWREPWAQLLADQRPLLLTHAAPLARYGLTPLLSDLLDQSTVRPAARWLLVPHRGAQPVPLLDGQPVPLGPDRWIDLPRDLAPGVPA